LILLNGSMALAVCRDGFLLIGPGLLTGGDKIGNKVRNGSVN
jgi:hypothetical protein